MIISKPIQNEAKKYLTGVLLMRERERERERENNTISTPKMLI